MALMSFITGCIAPDDVRDGINKVFIKSGAGWIKISFYKLRSPKETSSGPEAGITFFVVSLKFLTSQFFQNRVLFFTYNT